MNWLRAFACAFMAAPAVLVAASAHAIDILPHRAVYEMDLDSAESRSNIADVEGFMAFEWRDSCDGWSITQKMAMTVYYSAGESTDFGWTLNSWEAKNGLKYGFFVRRLQDNQDQEVLRGSAELLGEGKSGVAHYTEPERRDLPLPAGTLFPTAHTLKVLEEAEAGGNFFWNEVFDGSDEQGLFGVGVIIGKRMQAPADPNALRELAGVASWRLGLAFFPHASKELEPEHEQNLRLYHNGVAEDLVLQYGDFSVRAVLKQLETLPPGC
ncbi:MAG TPA: DUF1849 family protein [Alphaproteobacteria bacterium]|jgi:hypothetical protein|nr:DUF1849 family protein [Alphaproteobacteria bacterium]